MSKKNTRNALDTSLITPLSASILLRQTAPLQRCLVPMTSWGRSTAWITSRCLNKRRSLSLRSLRWSLAAATVRFPCACKIWGTRSKVISGHAVKNWIATHKSNQKTDLNDATALAKLALYDHDLQPIRVKNVEECRIASVRRSESNWTDTGYKILSLL